GVPRRCPGDSPVPLLAALLWVGRERVPADGHVLGRRTWSGRRDDHLRGGVPDPDATGQLAVRANGDPEQATRSVALRPPRAPGVTDRVYPEGSPARPVLVIPIWITPVGPLVDGPGEGTTLVLLGHASGLRIPAAARLAAAAEPAAVPVHLE